MAWNLSRIELPSWKFFFKNLPGGLPDWTEFKRFFIRLVAAMALGAIVGYDRERAGKAAGLRTHMLVAMGSALFVISTGAAGMSMEVISRVIQGLATGLSAQVQFSSARTNARSKD